MSQALLMDLFEDRLDVPVTQPAVRTAAISAPAAPEVDVTEAVRTMWKSVDRDQLPETLDALKRIPEPFRSVIAGIANEVVFEEFTRLATPLALREAAASDGAERHRLPLCEQPKMLANSAKLSALSLVSSAAGASWHLADPAMLDRLSQELRESGDIACIDRSLAERKAMNLFVAAGEADDRSSYLKSISALVKRLPVNGIVFDAELVEWLPEAEFLEACAVVGLPPVNIGIADRSKVGQHSMMRAQSVPPGIAIAAIDTAGRRLELDASGAVTRPEAPVAQRRVASKPAVRLEQSPAAPAEEASASPSTASPRELTSGVSARIRERMEAQRRKLRA